MCEIDYTCVFEYISLCRKEGLMHLTDHATNQIYSLQVSADDDQLARIRSQSLPPLLADLIDIAMAVQVADRYSKSKGDMPRRLLLRLPIRERERIDTPALHKKLQDILYWFTEDCWSFEFIPYMRNGRSSEIQAQLPLALDASPPTRVVLWSGGLDAFAGLYQLLLQDNTTHYVLFGTGSNDLIGHTQRCTAANLEILFPQRTKLVQLPLHQEDKKGCVKENSHARSRGFVFLLLGAVCAHLEGLNMLSLCENGIGAINLPFRKSEVGLDHTRSVHPLSLFAMSSLLSSLFEQPFTIENPFLFWTKAQMCQEPFQRGASRAMFSTISCDSRHRKRPMQCGYCSSCLLRRQAIAVHGIADQSGYQITSGATRQRKPDDGLHYYAMLEQVNTIRILLSASERWEKMSQHYMSLGDIVEKSAESQAESQKNILNLYQKYVQEWETAKQLIGPDFLE